MTLKEAEEIVDKVKEEKEKFSKVFVFKCCKNASHPACQLRKNDLNPNCDVLSTENGTKKTKNTYEFNLYKYRC